MFKIHTEGHIDKIPLSTIEGVNHSILWDRAGEVRLIPWPVIRNAREMLESWYDAVDAGIIDTIDPRHQAVSWDSCLGLPAPSSVVRVKQVRENPSLGLLQQDADTHDEDGPTY